jgi:hypothetical protein
MSTNLGYCQQAYSVSSFLLLLPKPEIENYNAVVGRYRELSEMDLRVVMPEADDLGVGMREVVDRYT